MENIKMPIRIRVVRNKQDEKCLSGNVCDAIKEYFSDKHYDGQKRYHNQKHCDDQKYEMDVVPMSIEESDVDSIKAILGKTNLIIAADDISNTVVKACLSKKLENYPAILFLNPIINTKKSKNQKTFSNMWAFFGEYEDEVKMLENETKFMELANMTFHYNPSKKRDFCFKDDICPIIRCLLDEYVMPEWCEKNVSGEWIKRRMDIEFIHSFSDRYLETLKRIPIAKLEQLQNCKGNDTYDYIADFHRIDIPGDYNHIIYRYRPNGKENPVKIKNVMYDFLIEYHRLKPSEGIYYGCKGELDGKLNLSVFCDNMDDEYETHRETIVTVLNNIFPEKKFRLRLKPTDNVHCNRYWPFWITLNDDEDAVEVAARAVRHIARIYEKSEEKGGKSRKYTETKEYVRVKYSSCEALEKAQDKHTEINGLSKPEFKAVVMKDWEERGLIEKDKLYEYGWRINGDLDDFFKNEWQKEFKEKNCYSIFESLFLDENGKGCTNIRTILK